ncbi:NlpC/P60 family protein [Streptomyces xanthochromogenes]|uniref:C40 family peptidase n=1 Tax=Streptomyces xanthochromogenes TaxID=67384 RepID=UPI003422965A
MTKKTKKGIAASAALLGLLLIILSAIAAHVAGTAQAEAQTRARAATCAPDDAAVGSDVDTAQVARQVRAVLAGTTSDIKVSGLSDPKEQIANAKVIVATGSQLGVSARGQVVALATALAESDLHNLDHGDRDSLGLFQQRPSQGWGSRQQILDPVYASTKFYNALKSVQGWEQMPVTVAAQTVQKSAYPDAYAPFENLATALQQAITPLLGPAATTPAIGVAAASTGCDTPADTDYGTIPAGKLPPGYQIPPAPPAVQQAIRWALQQLGTPYQWGGSCTNPHGNDPQGRCDCSSLTQRSYGVAGIQLTRTTYTQINEGHPVPLATVQPGDLLFSEGSATRPEHVAMAIGDGLLVQAPRPGRVVEVATIKGRTILAVRRVVP